jgi:hypothetical protein
MIIYILKNIKIILKHFKKQTFIILVHTRTQRISMYLP